jgi:hypothetical protein
MCHVVRFSHARCILIRIFTTPSDMDDGLVAMSKRSNSTFIMLHMYTRWMSTTW